MSVKKTILMLVKGIFYMLWISERYEKIGRLKDYKTKIRLMKKRAEVKSLID